MDSAVTRRRAAAVGVWAPAVQHVQQGASGRCDSRFRASARLVCLRVRFPTCQRPAGAATVDMAARIPLA